MTQYIDKAALVAEIEKRKQRNHKKCTPEGSGAYYEDGFILDIINSTNTFEVKEADINKEISQFIDANFEKATIGHKLSLRRVAKHFFELGLKAMKGE